MIYHTLIIKKMVKLKEESENYNTLYSLVLSLSPNTMYLCKLRYEKKAEECVATRPGEYLLNCEYF